MRIVVLLLLVLAACTTEKPAAPEAPPPRDGGPVAEPAALPWPHGLPILTNVAPSPPAYVPALGAYRTATTAVAHGDLVGGADRMIQIAKTLHLGEGHPHRETFEATRCMLYENAAAAWLAANEKDLFLERLGALLKEDPACKASIEAALTR